MNLPNKLTVLRMVLVPVFLVCALCPFPCHTLAALAVFAAAAITDKFDGHIARSRGLVTTFGKFMDPLADKLLTMAAFLVLMQNGTMPLVAVAIILARELSVTALRSVAAGQGVVLAADNWGKAKTVVQFITVLYCLAMPSAGELGLALGTPFAVAAQVLVWASVALTVVSGIRYFYRNRHVFAGEI